MPSAISKDLSHGQHARIILCLLVLTIAGCGGGGGGGGSDSVAAPPPEPTEPAPEPEQLTLLDALPGSAVTNMHPGHDRLSFAHLAQSDLSINLAGDCDNLTGTTIRRSLFDLVNTDFDQILDHRIRCLLNPNTAYELTAEGTRPNDAAFEANHSFSTGTESQPGINVLDQQSLTRDAVDDLFTGYVEGALIADLDLPSGVESLILGTILELAEANWDNLVDPDARYDVIAERVSYLSRRPDGSPDATLSGLIVRPDVTTATRFTERVSAIVLTHATGSTPGELNPADAWYILANQFAARGYLVIAPDNYGRGATNDMPETYLLANRTADNATDLINQVFNEPRYKNVYDGSQVTIVGYSQGGHSAFGLWLALTASGSTAANPAIIVDRVYAGGAPHNLYQTFRGVLQHLNGTCNDADFCRFVDEETTVPFATDRILPGLLTYTDARVTLTDIVAGETINAAFVSDFLTGTAELDTLKALLQLNSFTDIDFTVDVFTNSTTLLHLYHSDFDRLVPKANTEALAAALGTNLSVDFHENRCNADGYEVVFNLTEKVGVLHTLCGLAVLDAVMEDLR